MRNLKYMLLVAALAASIPACNSSNDAPPPQLAPTANNEPAPATPEKRDAMADDLERSELDAAVPFVLNIEVPEAEKSGDTITIYAHIEAPKKLNAAATIHVALPKGATLVEGQAEETLAYLPAGLTKRVFKVSGNMSPSEPLKIQVQVKDPAGAFGAFAERSFPQAQPVVKKSSNVPRPPVSRPGAGIQAPPGQRSQPQFRIQ